MAKGIGIKIGMDRVVELYKMYGAQLRGFESVGDGHDELLFSHCVDMHHKLKLMVAKNQVRYTFRLTVTEAIAFKQMWESEVKTMALYGAEIVRSIIAKVKALPPMSLPGVRALQTNR